MKKFSILMSLIILILSACTDNVKFQKSDDVRIEYSKCTGCLECVEDFHCPYDAIKIDYDTGKAYIDADHCTQCLDCMTEFQCDYDAFTTINDKESPSIIEDFIAISDSTGKLEISFTAVGDDGTWGEAHHYQLDLFNGENSIGYDFALPIPKRTGEQENWTIFNLPENILITINLKVFDEVGNFSQTSSEVEIMGQIEDTIAPAAILDLEAQNPTTDSVVLNFTAVGDDENIGTASAYDIRYSLENIDETNWNNATEFIQSFIPLSSGSTEQLLISGLEPETEYYFAIKAIDENNNYSPLSNVINISTEAVADTIAPATISDLTAELSNNNVLLAWTAVGDDENIGTALYYEIKISEQLITEANWDDVTTLENPPIPAESGTTEEYLVTDLIGNTTYYFAIKAIDESDNASSISNCVDVTTAIDEIAPAAITDLQVHEGFAAMHGRIRIEWTAPGDNENEGVAASYEIRYSTNEITDENWDSAEIAECDLQPQEAGTSQYFDVNDLEDATIYYFAIKTTDASGNVSEISNSSAGKIVFQINEDACHDCNACINDCDYDAIYDAGQYKTINPDLCTACGDCTCPFGLIHLWVVGY